MFDRRDFWPPLPAWHAARLEHPGLRVTVTAPGAIWRLSGHYAPLLAGQGDVPVLGPREPRDALPYALRLAPDSVLLVCTAPAATALRPGANGAGAALSDLTDGIVCVDVEGPRAAALLALGSEHPFESLAAGYPLESARLLFAGLRVAVLRRSRGWRLHVERPWAPALWQWFTTHAT